MNIIVRILRFYFLEKSFGNKLLCFFILMEFMRDNNRKKVIDVFSRMFEVNYSKVKNLAYSLLKSELDAEDVAQEVFTKLWEQQSIWIDNKRELDAYILIMTKNIALNNIRKSGWNIRSVFWKSHQI